MADVNISKYRASVVRDGSKPASPGFVVSEGQDPVDPAGTGQNHLPVTIAEASNAFSITESQIFSGTGTVSQYVRGDGSLADFPESSGGGSSISYYLNGSISQGTIGGVAYKELNKVPILGAGTDFTINADGYIASFISDAGDPNLLEIPGGNWNFETYFSASSGGGSPTFYVELYKVNSGGTATLIASNSTFPELIAFGTNIISYFSTLAVPTTALALTDRLAIRYYVTHSGRTITLHTEDNHLCQIITTFTTGLTALNGLTAQIQNFAVGTSGTDFNIASATATHTFNLPTASATNRGALSAADWSTFNAKMPAITFNSPLFIASGGEVGITQSSGSTNGFLSSTDWTTFNNKQNALTNPVTGTGTTNYLPKFTGASTVGNSIVQDTGTRIDVAGVLRLTPSSTTDIQAYTGSAYSNLFYDAASHNWQTSGGTAKMTLVAGGNLLVGTTTDNGARLQVSGSATVSSTIFANTQLNNTVISTSDSTNITNGFNLLGSQSYWGIRTTTAGNFALDVYGAGSTRNALTILQSSGNVGIGTTSPAGKLEVRGLSTFAPSATLTAGDLVVDSNNKTVYLGRQSNISGDNTIVIMRSRTGTVGFSYNPSDSLTFFNDGNVLIGTTTDNGARLQVSGEGKFYQPLTNTTSYLTVENNRARNSAIRLKTTVGDFLVGVGVGADTNQFQIYDNTAGANRLTISSTGAATFSSLGTGTVYSNGGTLTNTNPSDFNLKENIAPINYGLSEILQLNAVTFNWKNDTINQGKQYGFIAQEVEKIMPDLVKKGEYLGLDKEAIFTTLVKAIQELKQEIDTLKN